MLIHLAVNPDKTNAPTDNSHLKQSSCFIRKRLSSSAGDDLVDKIAKHW